MVFTSTSFHDTKTNNLRIHPLIKCFFLCRENISCYKKTSFLLEDEEL